MMFKFWETTTKEHIQETNMEPRKTGGHSPLFVDGRTFDWTLITNKVETASCKIVYKPTQLWGCLPYILVIVELTFLSRNGRLDAAQDPVPSGEEVPPREGVSLRGAKSGSSGTAAETAENGSLGVGWSTEQEVGSDLIFLNGAMENKACIDVCPIIKPSISRDFPLPRLIIRG